LKAKLESCGNWNKVPTRKRSLFEISTTPHQFAELTS
jgi:hypothetical protein